MLTLNDGRKELFQWDIGRKASVSIDCTEVHFAHLNYADSIAVAVVDGEVEIPNQLLTVAMPLFCWAFVEDADGHYTKQTQTVEVVRRAKPSDYLYTETEVVSVENAVKQGLEEAKASGDFKGDKGEQGIQGIQGEKGEDGLNGKDGANGKDGGYYAPFVVQDSVDSFTIGFEPNGDGMPEIEATTINFPVENFVATYNQTTWEELTGALNAGKHLYAQAGANIYVLISITTSLARFSRAQQGSIDYLILNSSGKWSSSSVRMSDAENIKFADGENLQDKYDNGDLGGPLTDSEKQEIVNAVIAALPIYNGEVEE